MGVLDTIHSFRVAHLGSRGGEVLNLTLVVVYLLLVVSRLLQVILHASKEFHVPFGWHGSLVVHIDARKFDDTVPIGYVARVHPEVCRIVVFVVECVAVFAVVGSDFGDTSTHPFHLVENFQRQYRI